MVNYNQIDLCKLKDAKETREYYDTDTCDTLESSQIAQKSQQHSSLMCTKNISCTI